MIVFSKISNYLITFLYHQKPLIGVKGRIQSREYINSEDEKKQVVEVVVEKVTFLSSKKADE